MSHRKENPHVIGTAFTDEDVENKTVPVWEQVVKDEKGRRRFHGAFTGGFSAGHFNTVGTPEGWTPSEFSSSRKNRSGKKEQTPEMFMDAEDLNEELGHALKTRDEFKSFGTQQKPKLGKLEELLVPAKDPVGVKLLRLMGWREGQGIGPRRTKKKVKPKTQQPKARVLGPRIPQEVLQTLSRDEEPEEDDEEEVPYKSAAEDVPTIEYLPKSDIYGLGYDPFTAAPEFKKPSVPVAATQKNAPVLRMSDVMSGKATGGKAFGLGAFEEDEEDDVYSHDAMEAYDRVLGGEEAKPQKQAEVPKEPVAAIDTSRRCSDGTFPLRNFKLASLTTQKPKWFDPPKLPNNYTPNGPFASEGESTATTTEERFQRGNGAMDAKRRGEILGETPLPSSKPAPQQPDRSGKGSVFDLISKEDRARLENLKNKFSSAGTETYGVTQESNEIEWQKQKREMEEHQRKVFAETQEKFKPLGAMMSQRFVKESEPGTQPKSEYKTDTYQETAAQMGMYGRLTRSVQEWYPENLVCRRFGVKNPHAGRKAPEKSGTGEFLGSGWELGPGFSTTENEVELRKQQEQVKEAQLPDQQPFPEFESNENNNNVDELDAEEVESEPEEPPPQRISMDIFKAIFENDDDDDISLKPAPTTNNNNVPKTEPPKPTQPVVPPKPVEAPKLPAPAPPPPPQVAGPVPPPSDTTMTEAAENPYLHVPPKQDSRGGRQIIAPVPPPEVKVAIEKERQEREKEEKKEKKKEKKDKKHKKHKDKKEKKHKKHKRSRSGSPSRGDKKHRNM